MEKKLTVDRSSDVEMTSDNDIHNRQVACSETRRSVTSLSGAVQEATASPDTSAESAL